MIDKVFDYLRFLTTGLFVTVLLCAPVACAAHRDHKITEMVKAGADPQVARCAVAFDNQGPNCLLIAAGRK